LTPFQRIFVAASKIITGQWLGILITMAEGVLLARYLGPSTLGKWALLVAIFSTVSAIFGFRVSDSLMRNAVVAMRDHRKGDVMSMINAAITVDLYTTCITIGVALAFGPTLASQMHSDAGISTVLMLTYVPVLATTVTANTWSVLVRLDHQLWRLSLLPAGINTLRVLALAAMWVAGEQLSLMHLAMLFASTALLTAMAQWIDIRGWKHKHDLPPDCWHWRPWQQAELHEFFRFMRAGFITSTFGAIVKNADVLLLGLFSTTAAVAQYKLAKSLAGAVQTGSTALSQVILADLSTLAKGQHAASVRSLMQVSVGRLLLPISAAFIAFGFIMEQAIPWIYGEPFSPASSLVLILLVGTWVSLLLFWVSPMMLASNELRGYVLVQFITTVLTLLAQFALTPTMGAKGSAIAFSVALAVGPLLGLFMLRYTSAPSETRQ
jgi:O-antigen/teichoic acid export membrane protein